MEGALQYELEYILAGKNSDIENLRWVAGRLILFREAANAVYLYSDRVKVAEADAKSTSSTKENDSPPHAGPVPVLSVRELT